MKSKTGWILAIALVLVFLFFLPSLLMGRIWMGGYGSMMDGLGYMNALSFFGMTVMWLVPAGLLVLLVVGAVALINGLTKSGNAAHPASGLKCLNCGKPAQADWTTCPYCGKSL